MRHRDFATPLIVLSVPVGAACWVYIGQTVYFFTFGSTIAFKLAGVL